MLRVLDEAAVGPLPAISIEMSRLREFGHVWLPVPLELVALATV
jgi:hypothetical protein